MGRKIASMRDKRRRNKEGISILSISMSIFIVYLLIIYKWARLFGHAVLFIYMLNLILEIFFSLNFIKCP